MKEYHIYITDTIGWPISARYIRQELAKFKDKHVDVFVNSLGGAVSDALEIRQMFIDHGDVTCHIHGMTASAATILAMGAKKIVMGKFAFMLVHKVSNWVDTWGQMNADELAHAIEQLSKDKEDLEVIDQVVANLYSARTGMSAEDMATLMQAGKWLDSKKCKQLNLVDEITEDDKPSTVTDELQSRFMACGYDMPAVPKEEKKSLAQKVKEILGLKGQAAEDDDQPQNPLNNSDMTKKLVAVCALLSVAALEADTDGKVTLTEEQLTALENELTRLSSAKKSAEDQLSTLQTENASLKEQVTNLQKGDGADDNPIVEHSAADEIENPFAAAKENYEKIKNLL